MGLEAVEILMEVEEAFDIAITDAEAEKMETPRHLIDAIMSHVKRAEVGGCLTQRAFNLLRKSLLRHLPLKRTQVAPSVCMKDLVPKASRRLVLAQIQSDLHMSALPGLVRPRWLVALLVVLSVSAGFATAVALPQVASAVRGRAQFWGALVVAATVGIIAWAASSRACTEFPSLAATVGSLSRWITAHKPDLATPLFTGWTREQVAARVREIVVEHLGCESRYREDASFIKELGLN